MFDAGTRTLSNRTSAWFERYPSGTTGDEPRQTDDGHERERSLGSEHFVPKQRPHTANHAHEPEETEDNEYLAIAATGRGEPVHGTR